MASVKQFEDLICWQKSRELTKFIYEIAKKTELRNDNGLKDQICRASVSVMSNIAEGFDRGTRESFVNYLYIAKGSCGEVKCQLYICYDIGYINKEALQRGIGLSDETSRLIQSFAKKVKTGAGRGIQYKAEKKEKEDDFARKVFKETNPEMYKRFYGDS